MPQLNNATYSRLTAQLNEARNNTGALTAHELATLQELAGKVAEGKVKEEVFQNKFQKLTGNNKQALGSQDGAQTEKAKALEEGFEKAKTGLLARLSQETGPQKKKKLEEKLAKLEKAYADVKRDGVINGNDAADLKLIEKLAAKGPEAEPGAEGPGETSTVAPGEPAPNGSEGTPEKPAQNTYQRLTAQLDEARNKTGTLTPKEFMRLNELVSKVAEGKVPESRFQELFKTLSTNKRNALTAQGDQVDTKQGEAAKKSLQGSVDELGKLKTALGDSKEAKELGQRLNQMQKAYEKIAKDDVIANPGQSRLADFAKAAELSKKLTEGIANGSLSTGEADRLTNQLNAMLRSAAVGELATGPKDAQWKTLEARISKLAGNGELGANHETTKAQLAELNKYLPEALALMKRYGGQIDNFAELKGAYDEAQKTLKVFGDGSFTPKEQKRVENALIELERHFHAANDQVNAADDKGPVDNVPGDETGPVVDETGPVVDETGGTDKVPSTYDFSKEEWMTPALAKELEGISDPAQRAARMSSAFLDWAEGNPSKAWAGAPADRLWMPPALQAITQDLAPTQAAVVETKGYIAWASANPFQATPGDYATPWLSPELDQLLNKVNFSSPGDMMQLRVDAEARWRQANPSLVDSRGSVPWMSEEIYTGLLSLDSSEKAGVTATVYLQWAEQNPDQMLVGSGEKPWLSPYLSQLTQQLSPGDRADLERWAEQIWSTRVA